MAEWWRYHNRGFTVCNIMERILYTTYIEACPLYVVLTCAVSCSRKTFSTCLHGSAIVMLTLLGVHLRKKFSVYSDKSVRCFGFMKMNIGEDNHSQSCSLQSGSVETLVNDPLAS